MNVVTSHLLMLDRPLAVLDSEWTSKDPAKTRMLSLAVIRLEPDGTATEHGWRFNPGVPIDPGAVEVHGITEEMASREPPFEQAAGAILETLRGCDIGGYNVTTDLIVLQTEFQIARREFSLDGRHIVDAYRLWQVREPRKLADAYRRYVGEVPDDASLHDAAEDARLTLAVIEKQIDYGQSPEQLHEEALASLVDLSRRFRRNEDGVVVFGFGAHMDQPAADHLDYVRWMLGKDFSADTKRICQELLSKAG